MRFEVGGEHPIHARRPRGSADNANEQILFDEAAAAKDKPFFDVSSCGHSPDHSLFAWAVDEQGSEFYRIYVKNLADGSILAHPVESANGDFEFTPDSQYMFWVWRDENARPTKVFRR